MVTIEQIMTAFGGTSDFVAAPLIQPCLNQLEIEMRKPTTEKEVIEFIGHHFNSMQTHGVDGSELPLDMIYYNLSVHDLLSAFNMSDDCVGWQPIETALKDGTSILIKREEAGECLDHRVVSWDIEAKNDFNWHVSDSCAGFNHHNEFPTHWMNLPE